MNNNENSPKEINTGVNCLVSDCKYHLGHSGCTAAFINIKNKNAVFSTGTKCDTYRNK